MSRRSYASALDEVLKPLGFHRMGKRWSRLVGSVQEEIDLQVSSIAGTTANLWTKDVATEDLLREAIPWKRPIGIIQEGYRIGGLMEGNLDRWWKNDPNGPVELAEAIRLHAPAYFESRRGIEDQARYFGRNSPRWGPAPTRIYLALTLYRMGEFEEANQALENPPRSLREPWTTQVDSVRAWLQSRKGEADVRSKK
jgi:hypothetical protein